MVEIITGLAGAAWLLNEPFGSREIVGTALIGGAVLTEAFTRERRAGIRSQ